MPDVELDISTERVQAGQDAGDTYIEGMEQVRDTLDRDDNSGTTLGQMVSSQIAMTEIETIYQVTSGIPIKASKAVKAAATKIAQS